VDQLKQFAAWMRKNYFWVTCGVLTVMSLAIWWLSTSSLAKETATRVGTLTEKEKTAQSIIGRQNHPNPVTHTKMDEQTTVLIDDVFDAWQQQYEKQREILIWPSHLGAEMLSIVGTLQPIEAKVKFPLEREDLNLTQRTQYRDFIYVELPRLAEIIGAEWSDSRNASMATTAARPEKPPIVVWSSSDQAGLQQSRFNWGGRIPSTLQVLYAQEDLWVLRSIMEIVKATNGDIEYRYQAAVKTIEYIDIGSAAIGMGGSVGAPGGGGGMSMDGGAGGGFPSSGMGGKGGTGGMMMSGMGGMGGGGLSAGGGAGSIGGEMGGGMESQTQAVDPGDNRYVDLKFAALTAQKIRSATDSSNPEDAFLIVAKRIPVRMRMKVDQRKLPKLIAECGNAKLQLEVKQVRINRSAFRTGGGGGGGGMMMGGMGGDGAAGGMLGAGKGGGAAGPPGEPGGAGAGTGGAGIPGGNEPDSDGGAGGGIAGGMMSGPGGMMGGGMMGGGMMGGMAGRQGQSLSDETPYDLDVELYGTVYIYNPVNRDKLGKKLDEPAQGAAPSETTTTPPANEAAG